MCHRVANWVPDRVAEGIGRALRLRLSLLDKELILLLCDPVNLKNVDLLLNEGRGRWVLGSCCVENRVDIKHRLLVGVAGRSIEVKVELALRLLRHVRSHLGVHSHLRPLICPDLLALVSGEVFIDSADSEIHLDGRLVFLWLLDDGFLFTGLQLFLALLFLEALLDRAL